ncbi:MAG: thiaminase II [Firmicutes bacterium]|nr:thiaminase II [Bacillota bacterium]
MKTSERLFESVKEIWESYNRHPFVKGIADGTLPLEKFRFYMIQDHLYLMQYAKVFALGVVKASEERHVRAFAAMIDEILNTENAVHQNYLKKLGISKNDIETAKMSLANESYTSYMISVGLKEGLAEIAVAVLACSWSYKMIGDFMKTVPGCENHEFYGQWINSYGSDEYSKSNDVIIHIVDSLTENYAEEQLQNIEKIIKLCSKYEYAFWDMAWNMEM